MESYSPWQNAAKGAIRELKKGTARKILRTGSPNMLWDDCMVLESEIQSSTVNNIFELYGEVLKTKLRGETANITHICEFGWYDWVYYKENAFTYPDDKWLLGWWLGPSMDVGPALCAKILKSNGQCIHRSSYRHLTEDEINSPGEKETHQLFDTMVEQRFGEAGQSSDFGEGYEMPTYELYADDDGDEVGHATDVDDEPTPLTFDNYLGAEVVLPKGDDMMARKVVGRKRDSVGEPIR